MQEDKKNYLTRQSYEEYQNKLKYLQEVERPQVIEELVEARNQGDLSENAEYDAARDKQAAIEAEILKIQHILENCEVIENEGKANIVKIGSTIKAINLSTKQLIEATIVGALEADPFNNKISNTSPLAKAVLGKHVGETIQVDAPNKYKVKIESIL
ncbi:transcription elongation factor GreA [Metamycoplasma equirhinis]|uniref:Transcription elongation factor GreA n=1 Tax=Metamycoplasma equirhinis TaxID=92402 RepID=A0ABZ0PBG4_9BACT|nr:transcription elongation factor GreA [Metamycoplasma equirhinis]TPD97741.1 transcription elongation factor GreA [Metamycoplasma equirhinis]WPB54195.1 transcription elongation factor GreA [Metamycoplasma equirhinis]BDX52639.1 transcription elongation factor GreA [Metamycoplasma equirhinis]